jgi:hypothetical protein
MVDKSRFTAPGTDRFSKVWTLIDVIIPGGVYFYYINYPIIFSQAAKKFRENLRYFLDLFLMTF